MKTAAPVGIARLQRASSRGLSLVDLVVTVAIVGILSAVAVNAFKNVREGAQRGVAMEVVNELNQAIANYSQVNWEIHVDFKVNDIADEEWILLSLQWRDPTYPATGAPFMNPTWDPEVSDSLEDHRIRWNGRSFELLGPGEVAMFFNDKKGFKVNFDGGRDLGAFVTHPVGFYPVGPGHHTSVPSF